MRYESVALFVERARAASATFSLTDENAPIVADICRRLDGIPLAIELAAARVKMLSPQPTARTARRAVSGAHRRQPQTSFRASRRMRALIDWSHDLLDERERDALPAAGDFRQRIHAGGSGCGRERRGPRRTRRLRRAGVAGR